MMDYQTADAGPSRPAVGSAFLFREGDAAAAGPIWDPAFAGISAAVPLPLNPFSFVASESSHHGHHGHHGHAAAAAATPTTGAPPAWGLHAARAHAAPRVWPGIDTISNLSPGAAPGWMTPTPAPVAAQAAVAAQMFGYPPGSVGAMNWAAFPVQLSPTSTQHTLAGTAVGLRPVASLGHHDPASDFAQLPSPPQAPWVNTAGSSALDTRPRVAKFLPPSTRDVDTTLDLIAAQIGHSGPTSQQWPPAFYPPPVNPSERHHSADLSGARSSTSSTHGSVSSATVVHPSPPRPQPTARSPEAPSNTLAIVQYDPNTETRSSTKRPASEELTPNGMGSKTVKQVVVRDENGEVRGVKITFGARAKARAAFTEAQRQRTAQARKEGVCSRCKKSKRQCDIAQKDSLYVSCTLCTCTKIYKNAPRLPCFKATLGDVLFFRSGPAPNTPFFTDRRAVFDLGDLSQPEVEVKTLRLTQRIGSHQLTVYASKFLPMPGDVVSYKWQDPSGNPHELKMPPFCLTNMEKVQTQIHRYISSAKWLYLKSLEKEDELAWMTVCTAMRYAKAKPNSLVADTLSLWAISRMIEIPWEMCGDDTLGVSQINDPSSPHNGKTPIPPIIDTQLDQIIIQNILTPLRENVITKFEKLITPAKPEAWWDLYLSAFILLNHIERLARHSVFQARRHTMPGKFSNIPNLEAFFHTAKSILARFHFICNGSAPLQKLDWTASSVVAMARLGPEQVRFMQTTQVLIAEKEEQVRRLRERHVYEGTLYWAGQLFSEDFDRGPVRVVEVVEEEEDGAGAVKSEG